MRPAYTVYNFGHYGPATKSKWEMTGAEAINNAFWRSISVLLQYNGQSQPFSGTIVRVHDHNHFRLKRYPEPMAHGPEACEPSHPCGSR